jgi:hypothetical protein
MSAVDDAAMVRTIQAQTTAVMTALAAAGWKPDSTAQARAAVGYDGSSVQRSLLARIK